MSDPSPTSSHPPSLFLACALQQSLMAGLSYLTGPMHRKDSSSSISSARSAAGGRAGRARRAADEAGHGPARGEALLDVAFGLDGAARGCELDEEDAEGRKE